MTDKEKALLEKLKAKEQAEKKELAKKQRQFKDMCKKNFGFTPTEISDIIQSKNGSNNSDNILSNFGRKITTFYGLKSVDDIEKWSDIMLNDNSRNFWQSRS